MTGVYRSGSEYALQLISGTKETYTSMYDINVYRYLPNDYFNGSYLLKSINKIATNLKDSSNKILDLDLVLNFLKELFPKIQAILEAKFIMRLQAVFTLIIIPLILG